MTIKKRTSSFIDSIPVSTTPQSGPIDDIKMDGLTCDEMLDAVEAQLEADIAHSKAT